MGSERNGKIKPMGNKSKKYTGALDGTDGGDLVTVRQLTRYLNGELVTSVGAFNTIDTNRAIKLKVPGGFIYLPILLYP